jgi:hypothetical protein
MTSFWTRHGWGGMLLAALLVFGLMTPTIDTFICIADDAATVQDHTLKLAGKQLPEKPVLPHDDGDALCVHGHCHHYVGVAKGPERLAFAVAMTFREPFYGRYGPPPTAPQIELLRPPRA